MASVDLIDVNLEAIEMRIEDRLHALFTRKFGYGRYNRQRQRYNCRKLPGILGGDGTTIGLGDTTVTH
ncbi:hypothetical protein GW17_00036913 [Ensete ventricosum]|nr:hypothetical protein GW17_00036913 [Ensete ventricosum]RZS08657.1 hypothetical protein BHM03_00039661 [Ensete ventricosum]